MGATHIFKCYNHHFFKQKKAGATNDLYQTYAQNIAQNFICEFDLLEIPSDPSLMIKCPHCKEENFDNGLEAPIRCRKCFNFFISGKKGVKKIKSDLTGLYCLQSETETYQKTLAMNELMNISEMVSILLYVNSNTLSNDLISPDGDIKYFEINLKVLIPFFSKKARVMSEGCVFLIDGIEFKNVGCEPFYGKITKNTKIQCYKKYRNDQFLRDVGLYPILNENSHVNENELQSFFKQKAKNKYHFSKNQIITINDDKFLIASCYPSNGVINSLTNISVNNSVLKPMKAVEFIFFEGDLKNMIQDHMSLINFDLCKELQTNLLKPYFFGMCKYLEKGSFIRVASLELYINESDPKCGFSNKEMSFTLTIKKSKKSFFESLKIKNGEQKNIKIPKNSENIMKISHIRNKSQKSNRKRNNLTNFQEIEYIHNPNIFEKNEEESKSNFEEQPAFENPVYQPNFLSHNGQRLNGVSVSNENPAALKMESLMQILYEERVYEQNRNQEKEKEGATKFQINRLPERKIDLEFIKFHSNIDQDCVTCLICLLDYAEGDVIRTMPCMHYFHKNCLDGWLNKNKACPICKTNCDIQV